MFEEVPIKAKPDTVAWLQEIQHNIEVVNVFADHGMLTTTVHEYASTHSL